MMEESPLSRNMIHASSERYNQITNGRPVMENEEDEAEVNILYLLTPCNKEAFHSVQIGKRH